MRINTEILTKLSIILCHESNTYYLQMQSGVNKKI